MSTVNILRDTLQYFEEPSRGPQPSDVYQAQYWEMAGAHALLINGLLSIYEQATTVPKEKHNDFVTYALLWHAVMEHHHTWEEEIYYPMFNLKFDTSYIVAEHKTFDNGVHVFEQYLMSCLPTGAKYGFNKVVEAHEQQSYDGEQLRQIIDTFAKDLATHLKQEITYLEPEKIRASGLTKEEVEHISAVSNKHMMSLPPTTFLAYTVLITPKTSGFPPAPAFVKKYLVPYVFYHANRRLWQFAPKR
ncbi:hypothetical protein K474DRAFT_1662382 [Panus rudis PR-1116 ss-1]|nr:hypothetical protein K474DRAFT_1662382 [Panus rudis PR-1116 ss-1]